MMMMIMMGVFEVVCYTGRKELTETENPDVVLQFLISNGCASPYWLDVMLLLPLPLMMIIIIIISISIIIIMAVQLIHSAHEGADKWEDKNWYLYSLACLITSRQRGSC